MPDARGLNKITVLDRSPTNSVRMVIDGTDPTCTVFLLLDLRWGFWHCPIRPEDRRKACFYGPEGHIYQFNVMAFGFVNAPAHFQKFVAHMCAGLEGVHPYVDDLMIEAHDWDELIVRFRALAERLGCERVAASISKLQVGTTITVLGGTLV